MTIRLLRLSTAGFDALRIRRIRRHLEFLSADDQLLLQDGLLGRLLEKDLDEALGERGMLVHSPVSCGPSYPFWAVSHKALLSR
jgi:hypothetical protein